MAIAISDLDISARIVTKEQRPNQYFEDQWHLIVLCCEQQQAEITALQQTVIDLQAQIDLHHP